MARDREAGGGHDDVPHVRDRAAVLDDAAGEAAARRIDSADGVPIAVEGEPVWRASS
jgi:hypothetical protein